MLIAVLCLIPTFSYYAYVMLKCRSVYVHQGTYGRGLGGYRQYLYTGTNIAEFMPELDFGQCTILLGLGFIVAIVCIRCLMAVVNRAFLVIDYAKAELSEIIPGAKGGTGKFGLQDLIGGLFQAALPAAQAKLQAWLGVTPPK